uniref:DNA (cytosine-5-)-methyltransferase n=2 Tax=Timema TaxID=61471 RepID=A0A7R9B4Y0_TIMSH|nr:unnamed protein product [Timema shepardi]CAD7577265.1 unnamed protein product [Timema californicum]
MNEPLNAVKRGQGWPRVLRTGRPGRTPRVYAMVNHVVKDDFVFLSEVPVARALKSKDSTEWMMAMANEVELILAKDMRDLVDRQYKYGKDQNGIMRGVCSCADGKVNESCNINDRQFNTLIPWWLPHTAERNNNFAGVYGRLDWEDHFSTTLTKPNPQGKQGRVIHPQEDRIITIRECARSQGFFDTFHFYGTIAERYRQVGNAVAPPLAAAIGYEIRKCLVQNK